MTVFDDLDAGLRASMEALGGSLPEGYTYARFGEATYELPVMVCQQAFDQPLIEGSLVLTQKDFERGAAQIDCLECDGTGKFELPDHELTNCVTCKTSGMLWVNII